MGTVETGKGINAPAPLVWAVRLLALLGGAALISTGECETLFVALFVCFFLLGIKMRDVPRLGRWLSVLQPVLALLAFSISIVDFLYLSKSFLLAVSHFLLMLEALQLLLLRTPRENLGGLLISSLMILSASTLAVEWTYFAFLCLYLPVLVWTLMLHTLIGENDANQVAFVPHTFVWARVMPKLRQAALMALFSALMCCAVVFILFPRFNFQGFRGQFLQPVRKTGFTNQVELGGRRTIHEDNSIAMRIELSKDDLEQWPGYIRGGTLEIFDGKSWKKAPYSPERIFQVARGKIRLPGAHMSGPRLRQKIYLESMDSPLLFAVSQPVFFHIDRPMLDTFMDGSVQRVAGDAWRIHYEVESVARTLSTTAPSPYALAFPQSGLERVSELSTRLTQPARNPIEKARSLKAYFDSGFAYSLDSNISLSDSNPTDTFLFETKTGHCEYFASALCLMLRSQGIPARIATGFYSTEWNRQGGYVIVRMRHAHAWVEAFIEGLGWVPLDPTPTAYRDASEKNDVLNRWSQSWDYLNLRWNRYILSYDFERQKSMFESLTEGSKYIGQFHPKLFALFFQKMDWSRPGNRVSQAMAPFLLLFLSLTIGVLVIFLIRFWQRSLSSKTIWFYKPFLNFLQRVGGKKHPSQTLSEYILAISSKLQKNRPIVAFLEETYHEIRFAKSARISVEEGAKIHLALKQLK